MILKTPLGVEVALFVENTLNVTQKMYDPYSHTGTMNIDFGGADGGKEAVYAPCKIIVKLVKPRDYGEVIVWSVNPVQWADGTVDHFSMRLLHCEDLSKLAVGQVIEQGVAFYSEGGMGPNGPTTYGKHVHLGVARGHTTTVVRVPSGYHQLANSVEPYKLFHVNGVAMRNNGGYPWVTYVPPVYAPMADVQNMAFKTTTSAVKIRSKPSTDYPQLGTFPKDSQTEIQQVSVEKCNGYDWVKLTYNGITGYSAVVEGASVFMVLTPEQILEAKLAVANEVIAKQAEVIKTQSESLAALEAEVNSFVAVANTMYTKN